MSGFRNLLGTAEGKPEKKTCYHSCPHSGRNASAQKEVS